MLKGIECLMIGINHMDAKIYFGEQHLVEERMSENDGEFICLYGKDSTRLNEITLNITIESLETMYGYDLVNLMKETVTC